MGRPKVDAAIRFDGYYIPEPNSGCWLWLASTSGRGYAQISINDRPVRAHMFSYERFNGPIPPGADVRHTCDTRCCVNPDHLLVGTRRQNVEDAVSRKRHAFGARHGSAKITEAEAIAIKESTEDRHACAARYGVSEGMVRHIREGRKWKHI
jgi:hypothetical protein